MALDADQHPRASFYRYGDNTLRYRAKEGANWACSTLKLIDHRGPDVGECSALAIAADGTGHISYYNSTNQAIRYARRSGGVWDLGLDDVVTTDEPNCRHSLALKSNGWPGVAYTNEAGELHYAFWTCIVGCGWLDTLVIDDVSVPESVSLAYDSDNRPLISYNWNGLLYYAYMDGLSWTSGLVDSALIAGQTSLAVDTNGHPQIAYFRSTNDLYYAVGTPPTGRSAGRRRKRTGTMPAVGFR